MITIEQFVFTDRKRGQGVDENHDGGFQAAACSSGILPEQMEQLVTMAGEIGTLFLNAFVMNNAQAIPPFGTEEVPLWCWTPIKGDHWALSRSVYLGQSVSSSRPKGNYLFHALLIRPEDLKNYHDNPMLFATTTSKQGLFWSQDQQETKLAPIEFESTPKRVSQTSLSVVYEKLSKKCGTTDVLKQLLSLVASLNETPQGSVLVTGLDAANSWTLMGMVLLLLPASMRSRISLSNVCFNSFMQSVTTPQAFVAMPAGVQLSNSNRVNNRIGQVNVATGSVDIVSKTYTPVPLTNWVVDHIDSTAEMYSQAEEVRLSHLADYEILTSVFDLLQTETTLADAPSGPQSASSNKQPEVILEKLFTSPAYSEAPEGWMRGLICKLLEAWYQAGNHSDVGTILELLARRESDENEKVLTASPTSGEPEDLSDFLTRLDDRIVNCLRLGNWCMANALLRAFSPNDLHQQLLKAIRKANPLLKLPESGNQEQVKVFSNLIQDLIAAATDSPEWQQCLTDVLFLLLGAPEVGGVFREATVNCLKYCAGLLRTQLNADGKDSFDEDQLQCLADSPYIKLVPGLSLLCSRVRVQQLIEQQLPVIQPAPNAWNEESAIQLAEQIAKLESTALQATDQPDAEIDHVLNTDVAMLLANPPLQALTLGLMWPDVPEICQPVVLERFRQQPLLLECEKVEKSGDSSPGDTNDNWRKWLLIQLIARRKPDLMLKWAFESSQPHPASEIEERYRLCKPQVQELLLTRLVHLIPSDPEKQSRYRHFLFGIADSLNLPDLIRAALLRIIVRLIRPGDKPPKLVHDESLCRDTLDSADQSYLLLVKLAWKAKEQNEPQEQYGCLWLDVWTDLQHYNAVPDPEALAGQTGGSRAQVLTTWVLTWLEQHGITTPQDMEIVARLLQRCGSRDRRTWTRALCLAAQSSQSSLVNFAALMHWFCRRNAQAISEGHNVGNTLRAMLAHVDSEVLRKLSGVLQLSSEDIPPKASQLLERAISSELNNRDKATRDSRSKKRKRVSHLLGWPFGRNADTEALAETERSRTSPIETPSKQDTEESTGAGHDS